MFVAVLTFEVQVILAAFFSDFGLPPQPIDIRFKPESQIEYVVQDPHKGERKAHARIYKYKYIVVINQDHWIALNEWQKRELIYHEMGHVIFQDYTHSADSNDIMNPFSRNVYWVKPDGSNWHFLVEKMKGRYGL
jgi:hypothetical protein